MSHDALLGRTHVVRRDDERADARRHVREGLRRRDRLLRVVRTRADDQRRVRVDAHTRARVDDDLLLRRVERRRFTGGAEGDDAHRTGRQVLPAQPFDGGDVDLIALVERRDQRDPDPPQVELTHSQDSLTAPSVASLRPHVQV